MSGVRIHHPTLKNCVLLVEHPGEIKKFILTKNKGRKAKDYHIRLDNQGNSIVSDAVWKRLQEAGANNFIVLNEVADPPAQIVGFHAPEDVNYYKEIEGAVRQIITGRIK